MKTILIVDDSEAYAKLLKHRLVQSNYNVVVASSGQEALEKTLLAKPDLILMDVMMPEQDGPETVIQIREAGALRGTLVVFLTALTSDEDGTMLVKGENYPTISKMSGHQKVVEKIKQCLGD